MRFHVIRQHPVATVTCARSGRRKRLPKLVSEVFRVRGVSQECLRRLQAAGLQSHDGLWADPRRQDAHVAAARRFSGPVAQAHSIESCSGDITPKDSNHGTWPTTGDDLQIIVRERIVDCRSERHKITSNVAPCAASNCVSTRSTVALAAARPLSMKGPKGLSQSNKTRLE